ncbi:hypothetical protein ACGFSG_34730 [Streptomyces sp. NPDC048512]|uniref:hypothetical protein n=1 Tax=Streptomyces sp. NPDC048512 TaxID=3365563 RepID=UPI0037147135
MNQSTRPALLASASYTGALWLMVAGIGAVGVLLVGFCIGIPRSSRRRMSTSPLQARRARHDLTDAAPGGDVDVEAYGGSGTASYSCVFTRG